MPEQTRPHRPSGVEVGTSGPRFGEVRWGVRVTVLRAFGDVVTGAFVGSGIAFGIALVGLIVLQEALPGIARALSLDPLARAAIGSVMLVAAVLALAASLIAIAARSAALTALERHARAEPETVPPSSARRAVDRRPGGLLRGFGGTLVGAGGGSALLCAAIVLSEPDAIEHVETWVGTFGGMAAVIVGAIARAVSGGVDARWSARADPLLHGWAALAGAADEAERRGRSAAPAEEPPTLLARPAPRRRRRIEATLAAVLLLSIGAFFLSVMVRQPCRSCDPIAYAEPGELAIDGLSLTSGIVLAATTTVLVAWHAAGLGLRVARERVAARWVADGRVRRAPLEPFAPLLVGLRAAEALAVVLGAVAAIAVTAGLAADSSGSALLDPGALLVAGGMVAGIGVMAGLLDAAPRHRDRAALRRALLPGDLEPAVTAARGRGHGRETDGRGAGADLAAADAD